MRQLPRMLLISLLMTAASPTAQSASEASLYYLPTSGWRDEGSRQFHERWFGDQLRAMNEPSLSEQASLSGLRQRFRLLVLPTFEPASAYRVDERPDGSATLHWVRLTGRGGYAPGTVSAQTDRVLRREEVQALDAAIAGAHLDALTREVSGEGTTHAYRDGSQRITVCADGVTFGIEVRSERGWRFVKLSCSSLAPLNLLIRTVIRLRPRTRAA